MNSHPLVSTLRGLHGNPRAAVFTEPLWGVPYNLYAPYASVYMLALGLDDAQIGLLASFGLAGQIVFSLLSGAITDKLGRRTTTFIFDVIAWTIPCLLLAFAQNFYYFLAAVLINSTWRITANSWSCLLVEDANQEELVHIWTWIYIASLVAAFFAPLAGLLVDKFSLVPTVRSLYLFAVIVMTIKFALLFRYSTETERGRIRLEETRRQSIFSLLHGYREVIRKLLQMPRTLFALGIMILMSITAVINNNFWAILVTQKLGIPDQNIAIFPTVRSLVMLFLFGSVLPRLSTQRFRLPMLLGFTGFVTSQALLVTMPALNYPLLILSVAIEAASSALYMPLMDALVVISVDPAERARIMSIIYVSVLVFSSPFGWIAGRLSGFDRTWPFYLNIGLYLLAGSLVWLVGRQKQG